jgi:hypothetical protein
MLIVRNAKYYLQVLKARSLRGFMMSNSNKKSYFASSVWMLLSVSVVSSIAIVAPNNASAQEDQQQRGLLGGLEREQSDESIPGQQPADIGGPAPLNRTIEEAEGGGVQPSACAPIQTGGAAAAGGGNQTGDGLATNATSPTTTVGDGGGENQTTSSPTQLIEQACMALQAGDIQGAMMQLNLALGQLREGGGTTTGGATNTTTGPGGIGTDDPSATDNPFSDLT